MGFVSASKGYKAGGFNALQIGPAFENEDVWNAEVGIKQSFGRFSYNASMFHYRYDNRQSIRLIDPDPNNPVDIPRFVFDTGDLEATGIDVDMRWKVTDAFTLDAQALLKLATDRALVGIVFVFVVLILLDKGDLRDKVVRLLGSNLHRTTDALGDALLQLSQRIVASPLQFAQPLWCAHAGLSYAEGQWFAAWPQTDTQMAPVPVVVSDNEAWRLLALTGGAPVTLFGEWEAGPQIGRWRLLSAWQAAEQGGALSCVWQNRGEML